MAAVAANGGDFEAVAADEQDRRGCDSEPVVTFPDGEEPGDRVRVTWTCHYTPRITSNVWDGIEATFVGESVIPASNEPPPSLSPS